MRILVFGEVIVPPAYSPRVRYFYSYFIKNGWDVDLVVEHSPYLHFIPDNVSVFPIDYYKYKTGLLSKIEWVLKFVLNLFFDYKGSYFYKKSQPFLAGKKIDLVFCSSSFTFPLPVAAKVANQLSVPLFVDLRDIVEQSPDDNHYLMHSTPKLFGNAVVSLYKKISVRRRNGVLKIAAGVTTVSPWHVKTLLQYNTNTHLIYNGFDESKFCPEKINTERFTIAHFGRIYNEQIRNPRLLFQVLEELHKRGILSPDNTIVKWYIDDNSKNIIQKMANEYGLELFMEYRRFIHPDELSNEMNKSSILLVLSNMPTKKHYFGIMTTKFFEAIGVNRPILCVPDNEDHLSELVKQIDCGLASSEPSEVELFLLDKFHEWQQTGKTKGTVKEAVRLDFSREKGAAILENLFQKAL